MLSYYEENSFPLREKKTDWKINTQIQIKSQLKHLLTLLRVGTNY